MAAAAQKIAHLTHALTLGSYDCLKDGFQLGANREAERVFRHLDSALMMRYHFPHEIGVYVVEAGGGLHTREHRIGNAFKSLMVQGQFLSGVLECAA